MEEPGKLMPEDVAPRLGPADRPVRHSVGSCIAVLDGGAVCGAPATFESGDGPRCVAHAQQLIAAWKAVHNFPPVPAAMYEGVGTALSALEPYEQRTLMRRLRGIRLPEAGPDLDRSVALRDHVGDWDPDAVWCGVLFVRLATGVVSCRWRTDEDAGAHG